MQPPKKGGGEREMVVKHWWGKRRQVQNGYLESLDYLGSNILWTPYELLRFGQEEPIIFSYMKAVLKVSYYAVQLWKPEEDLVALRTHNQKHGRQ